MEKKFLKILFVLMLICTTTTIIQAKNVDCSETIQSNVDIEVDNGIRSSSFLEKTGGGWMRLVVDEGVNGYMVDYFDESFEPIERFIVPQQLPIFGGFYASKQYYYIVTGQTNYDQVDSKETVRVSKYDKQWKHVSDAKLCNNNTILPFSAGNVQITDDGTYLFIHTAHNMYASDNDGLSHQSNMTFQIRISDMVLTGSRSNVSNTMHGYVSHSFNQFVKLDGTHLVTLDHGDAYPRALTMMKYFTDYSDGDFTDTNKENIARTDILSFYGERGDNSTGAYVGGFEISQTHYLVVGTTVKQDENFDSYTTRNLFVGTVDRSTLETKVIYKTNFVEGDCTAASNPKLVKINDKEFAVLYEVNDQLYYIIIDSTGKNMSSSKKIDGTLSDCYPVVNGSTINWFAYNGDVTTFHTLDLKDNRVKTKELFTGHKFQIINKEQSGYIKVKCEKCGVTKVVQSITDITTFWREPNSDSLYYSTSFNGNRNVGEDYLCMTQVRTGTGKEYDLDDVIVITLSDETVLKLEKTNKITFKALKKGVCNVTFASKYDPSVTLTKTFVIGGGDYQGDLISSLGTTFVEGLSTTITFNVKNASSDSKYCFMDSDGNVLKGYSSDNKYVFESKQLGKHIIIAKMKDIYGNIYEKSIELDISSVPKKTISKDDFELSFTNCVYDGKPHIAQYSANKNLPQPKITYKDISDSTISTEPIRAGVYMVLVAFDENEEYYGCELQDEDWKFVIEKKQEPDVSPLNNMKVDHMFRKVSDILLPKDWVWNEYDADQKLYFDKEVIAIAKYVGADKINYLSTKREVFIIRDDKHYGGRANCTTQRICEGCLQPYGELDKSEHSNETYKKNAKKADCFQPGFTGDIYCLECDDLLANGEIIPITSHTFDVDNICVYCEIHRNDYTKNQLLSLVNEVEQLHEEKYSDESWRQLNLELEKAYIVLNSSITNFKDYCKVFNELQNAMRNLKSSELGLVKNFNVKSIDYKTLKLSWDDVVNADYYEVYRKNENEWKHIGDTKNLNYLATVKTGVKYTYRIRPVNQIGMKLIKGDFSSQITGSTNLEGQLKLNLEKITEATIKLTWNKIDGATRYIIYRKSSSEAYKKVLTLGSDILSYTSGVLKPQKYTYIVKPARYDSTERIYGNASNEATVETKLKKPSIGVYKLNNNSVMISWGKVDAAVYYEVYRKTGTNGIFKKLKTLKECVYTSKSLRQGEDYYFKLRAYTTINGEKVYSPYSITFHCVL